MDSISWTSLREVAGQNTARATKPLHPLPSVLRKELAAQNSRDELATLDTGCSRGSGEPGTGTFNPAGDKEAEACGY